MPARAKPPFRADHVGSFLRPPGKTVVPGLITSKRGELEWSGGAVRRIDAASQYVPLDRLCLSPRRGFASPAPGNKRSPAEQEAKMQFVVDVTPQVWG